MKLKTAQKLQAQGRLTHKVMTEFGWYAPGPLKGTPAPFEEIPADELDELVVGVVAVPAKILAKRKPKKKVPVIPKAAPAKRKVVFKPAVKGKKKKHG